MKRDTSAIAVGFAVSALASLVLTVVYALGGQPQLEGALLGLALGGLAVGVVLFARRFLPGGHFVQPRHERGSSPDERAAVESDLLAGARPMERRGFVAGLFGVALGALGIASLFPIRSLGERPGRSLFITQWDRGVRLVAEDGLPLRLDTVLANSVVTVFPEGHVGSADSQALLIRLPEGVAAPGPPDWSVEGLVAFSKICTHAGCPVGLYSAPTQELFCPCHQSTFSVLEGARPTFGPATRPLPQLPLMVDDFGYVVAASDFEEPVGPGFWSRPA